MRWAWKIATVAGIPVRIHATFLLLLVFLFGSRVAGGQSPAHAAEGVGLIVAVFACVVLHEFGHALTARRYGVRTRDITLLPIGGVARLERIPEKPSQEIAVALAGPAVNVAISACLGVVLFLHYGIRGMGHAPLLAGDFLAQLLAINVFLAVFNLIPAFPMDGGRVLRALLATRLDYLRATQIAANIGQGIALLFGLAGIVWNPMLLFIALFVFIGAGQEAATVRLRSAFDDVPVARAMIRDFRTLRPEDPLSRAVELLLAGHQQDFPVVGERPGDPPVGVLTRADLLTALAGGNTDRRVDEVARRGCGTADPREMLEGVFARMQERNCPAVPVVDATGTVIGMVTLENVGELAMVHTALESARPRIRGV
jgi:Zn-dependent protease/CBS domain-containing protein